MRKTIRMAFCRETWRVWILPPSVILIMLILVLSITPACSRKTAVPAELPSSGRICLSLRVLCGQVESALTAHRPLSEPLMHLCGIGRLEGYVIDRKNHDVILIGERSPTHPRLHLDDLATNLANVWNEGDYPYCSLDPRPEDVLKRHQNIIEMQRARTVEKSREVMQRMERAVGDQTVVVGGVPRDSRHAHVMIDADYHMKKLSQGLVQLGGIQSCMDRMMADSNAKGETGTKQTMSRFWFSVRSGYPTFKTASDIVWLDACPVCVLTEQQKASADGHLHDVVEDDPVASGFAAELSVRFPQATDSVPVYADLEDLFRLQALLRALRMRGDLKESGLDADVLLNRYALQARVPMPASLPGLANHKELHKERTEGNTTYESWSIPFVCGGVSMKMDVMPASFSDGAEPQLAMMSDQVIKDRPSVDALVWSLDTAHD